MTIAFHELLEHDAPLPTWFGVGGRAEALASPATTEQLRDLVLAFADRPVRVIGEGANLLVDDEGVSGLVVSMSRMNRVEARAHPDTHPEGEVIVHAQAGADLPRLIVDCVRAGLAGLEGLAGIPASVGGATIMNAGGAFGEFGSVVHAVHVLTRFGQPLVLPRHEIDFDYRHSGLNHFLVTAVDLRLKRVPGGAEQSLRDRLKEVMAYKKSSQPLKEDSAGCCFKNPVVNGQRVSAGKLIDEAGCKGMRVGGATVSDVHANFIITSDGCTARDVIELMDSVEQRVLDHAGVRLEREVIVWRRGEQPPAIAGISGSGARRSAPS